MTSEKSPKSPKEYFCEKCDYLCFKPSDYRKHILTAKHLNTYNYLQNDLQKIADVAGKNYSCECGKKYKHRQSMYTHKKKCLFKNEFFDDEKDDDENKMLTSLILEVVKSNAEIVKSNNELQKQVIELSKEVEDLKKNNKDTAIHTQNNTTNIQTQNNIQNQNNQTNNNIIINCFGNENLDYITDKVILHCMNKIYGSILLLIEKIHFDLDHPENHNVQIPNKKLSHAKIMNHKREWQIVQKKDVIHNMMDID